jgi:hypothetical protein
MDIVNELVFEVLKLSGSRQRLSGTVTKIDASGTTVTVLSGEREFLAFQFQGRQKLILGDQVSFRIDNMRAKDVEVQEIPADSAEQQD